MLRNVKACFVAMMILLLGGSVYNSKALQWSFGGPSIDCEGQYYGLVATDDGKYLGAVFTLWGYDPVNYVSIDSGGIGYNHLCGGESIYYFFEISNGKIRANHDGFVGEWVDLNGSGESVAYDNYSGCPECGFLYEIIQVDHGKVRFCYNYTVDSDYNYIPMCGDWITLNVHSCPSGYTYNPSTRKCEATPTYSCPSGYSYNPSTRKCEMSAQITYTCPLGSYPCINTGSNYYCSSYQCVDIETPNNVETSDTTQGANDKQNDGPRDSNGVCKGIIRIFNGQDLRCRPPGLQTGWSDCCKKSKTWFGLGRCGSTEQQLAKLRTTIKYRGQERDYTAADANCHYVGSYCAQKIKFIGCVQKKKTYCCFGSPLARIIQEQGRPQIGKGWGDPKSPDCSGFTIDEFQKLDFSKIDFSEWVNMIVGQETTNLQNNLPGQTQQMQQNIQKMYQ